jgi:hypothetical protein
MCSSLSKDLALDFMLAISAIDASFLLNGMSSVYKGDYPFRVGSAVFFNTHSMALNSASKVCM